jgi:3-hydroxybutyryl-CoA dehydrogenase
LARHAAERGLDVRLVGRDAAHAEAGLRRLQAQWKRAVSEGRLDPIVFQARACRIQAMGTWEEALRGAAVLIEALPEDLPLKAAQWRQMRDSWPRNVLPLTGSSSLPASLIRRSAGLGPGLQNFHLFVPVHRHLLVELATPPDTPPIQVEGARDLAAALGLQVAIVDEAKGLAASRMGLAQGLEAMRLFEEGVGSARDLDLLMTAGYGHPCGPLELSDRVGLDLRLAIAQFIFESSGDPGFAPPEILKEKVAKGELGRKSGKGFYTWSPDGKAR